MIGTHFSVPESGHKHDKELGIKVLNQNLFLWERLINSLSLQKTTAAQTDLKDSDPARPASDGGVEAKERTEGAEETKRHMATQVGKLNPVPCLKRVQQNLFLGPYPERGRGRIHRHQSERDGAQSNTGMK